MDQKLRDLSSKSVEELRQLDKDYRDALILKLLLDLANSVDDIQGDLLASKIAVERPKVYTDEELYDLKQSLSWSKLSERTGIPVSTLQSKCRRVRDKF